MEIEYINILFDAELSSKIMNKVRFCLPEVIQPIKSKQLIGIWPKAKPSSEILRNKKYLQKLPHLEEKSLVINYYGISYEETKKLKNESNKLDYTPFIILSNYFAFKRLRIIANSNIKRKLVYAHDQEIIDGLDKDEISYNSCETIERLSNLIGGLWSVEYAENSYIKFPALHGQFVQDSLLKCGKMVTIKAREKISSKSRCDGTKRYTSYRYYIVDKDKAVYEEEIARKSEENMLALVADRKFYKQCEKNHQKYKKVKMERKLVEDF